MAFCPRRLPTSAGLMKLRFRHANLLRSQCFTQKTSAHVAWRITTTSRSDVFRGPSHLCKLQKRRTYSSQNSSSYIVSYWRENNSQILLWTTFALCLGVFGYQKWAEEQFRKHKNEKPMLFIAENFVLNLSNLRAGRWWTLITYSFTHFNGIHLVFNGVGLVNFGPVVVSYFGASGFVVCWVGSALAAGAASLLWEKTRKSGPTVTGAVGASGSLFGFLTMLAFHTPMAEVGMMYIPISFPIWSSMAVTAGVSITALALSWFPHLGHAGHLGGMTFGALYYFLRRRGKTIHIPRF